MNVRNRHGSAEFTLPSDREVVITRKFDAPARLMFKAWTTPELVRRWWGYAGWQWLVCEIDLRVGGGWRYVTREEKSGYEVALRGEFQEIDAPRRLVNTEVFEATPEAGAVNTITFVEENGVTTLTVHVLHSCKEHRDAHVDSGIDGVQVSMNRLEDALRALEDAV